MSLQFTKATKKRSKLRLAIDGPSGSGKTYTALIAATAMRNGGKIAVIDTERGSASLYSDRFDFDVLELNTYSPALYTEAIHAAEAAGYGVIVIDSLSHAWEGEGGALDLVDEASTRNKGNSYVAWRDVTPMHRKMIDTMLQSPAHIIVTMRSKMDYVQEKDAQGSTKIRKIGLAPIQRQGMEYEFTIVGDMDLDHKLVISKSRCDFIADAVISKPTTDFFKRILDWLDNGEPTIKPKPQPTPAPEPEKPWTNPKVSKETCMALTSSDGTKYWDMEPEPLRNRLIGIDKGLKKEGLTIAEKDDYTNRRDVINAILDYRH